MLEMGFKFLVVVSALFLAAWLLTGCAQIPTVNAQTIETRAALHAAMIRQAQETIREAQDWRTLSLEADKAVGDWKEP
jgi:hypothetical protein